MTATHHQRCGFGRISYERAAPKRPVSSGWPRQPFAAGSQSDAKRCPTTTASSKPTRSASERVQTYDQHTESMFDFSSFVDGSFAACVFGFSLLCRRVGGRVSVLCLEYLFNNSRTLRKQRHRGRVSWNRSAKTQESIAFERRRFVRIQRKLCRIVSASVRVCVSLWMFVRNAIATNVEHRELCRSNHVGGQPRRNTHCHRTRIGKHFKYAPQRQRRVADDLSTLLRAPVRIAPTHIVEVGGCTS